MSAEEERLAINVDYTPIEDEEDPISETLYVPQGTTVGELKTIIEEDPHYNVPGNKQIHECNGKLLCNDDRLDGLDRVDGDLIITLYHKMAPQQVTIKVNCPDLLPGCLEFTVSSELYVYRLKEKIDETIAISPHRQLLVLKSCVLSNNDDRLEDFLTAADESGFSVSEIPRKEDSTFSFELELENGEIVNMDLEKEDTIYNLRGMIRTLGYAMGAFQLYLRKGNDQELAGSSTLSEDGITEGYPTEEELLDGSSTLSECGINKDSVMFVKGQGGPDD